MTEARSFDIDLVAFVRDASAEPPWSTELAEQTRDLVTWEHVTRDAQPHLFEAPRFAPDPDGTIWAPMSEQRARALGDRIATASSAWRIKSSARADDSSPLHAAMGLSAAALVERDGIALVDARTQVGFDADDWCERVAVLTEEGAVTLCDFVRVEHVPDGDGTLSVRTRGMPLFGQRDLTISHLDEKYKDFATWLFLEAFGSYAALRRPLLSGQNFGYTRADPSSKLFFSEAEDGLLRVTDCHPVEKRAVPSLRRCLVNLFPSFLVQRHELLTPPPADLDLDLDLDEDDEDDDEDETKVTSLADYAALTRGLHGDDPEAAMQTWGVSWGTLAAVTYEWTAALAEEGARDTLEAAVFDDPSGLSA